MCFFSHSDVLTIIDFDPFFANNWENWHFIHDTNKCNRIFSNPQKSGIYLLKTRLFFLLLLWKFFADKRWLNFWNQPLFALKCLQGGWILDLEDFLKVNIRISRSQVFFKIGVLKTVATFTGKHLRCSPFSIKLLQHRCLCVNIANFLRTAFLDIHHF